MFVASFPVFFMLILCGMRFGRLVTYSVCDR